MQWKPLGAERMAQADSPTVVLRGVGWRMVAMYLEKLGGELSEDHTGTPAPDRRRVLAEISGKGWRARLHEEVEFTGAFRSNRVEVNFSGEPDAVEQVVLGLRRMAQLEGA
ncbi:MAG: hypothetical protein AB1609_02110 [Bacillota bacterium]